MPGPAPQPLPGEPGPDRRLIELLPWQMTALRQFASLADELRVPPAEGLAEQVPSARCDHGFKQWRLYLTDEQIASVAYGLWLHRMTGSAAEANRVGCEYGIIHHPTPGGRSLRTGCPAFGWLTGSRWIGGLMASARAHRTFCDRPLWSSPVGLAGPVVLE